MPQSLWAKFDRACQPDSSLPEGFQRRVDQSIESCTEASNPGWEKSCVTLHFSYTRLPTMGNRFTQGQPISLGRTRVMQASRSAIEIPCVTQAEKHPSLHKK